MASGVIPDGRDLTVLCEHAHQYCTSVYQWLSCRRFHLLPSLMAMGHPRNQKHAGETVKPDQNKRFRQLPKGMFGWQWQNLPWNFLQYFPLFAIKTAFMVL